ncbi:tetratricopeptide repeat protein [Rasiella rasia]|uniref:tetratricopeptide repeat protein n=1 Tax=Rasiella rasia TaxID=2744027 RepID=UPI0021E6BE94|nr:tetratricopeptide repeat protein [Rasiella rasia]
MLKYLSYFFLFLSTVVYSQNTAVDSLKNVLLLHKEKDTVRVNTLNELAFLQLKLGKTKTAAYLQESFKIADSIHYKKGKARVLYLQGISQAFQSNFDKGQSSLNEALLIYKEIGFTEGISECYKRLGLLAHNMGNQELAITYHNNAIRMYYEIGNKVGVAVGYNNLGRAYNALGDYINAIQNYSKSLEISEQLGDEKRMANCYNNIGTIYSDQSNYPRALEYYNKSLTIDEKLNDTIGISNTLNNMGIIYKNIQNYDKAIEIYERALKFQNNNLEKRNSAEILNNLGLAYKNKGEYKQAHNYLKEALGFSEQIKNKLYIATILNNIGDVHLMLKENQIALNYFERAKKIHLEVDNQRGLCNSYLGIAKAYTNQKKYSSALMNALESNKIAADLQLLDYQRDGQKLLSEIYDNLGNYENALTAHQQFKVISDSIFNKQNIEKITQLEYDYKYKQALDSANLRELKLTKTVKSTSADLEKSQRNLLLGVIAFLLMSLVFLGIVFFLKLRNEKIKTQNIVIEQKLLRSQMTPHFIFNSLSVLQGMILNKEDKKSVTYLSKFSKLLRITLENSRDKIVPLQQELQAVTNYLELQNLEEIQLYKYSITVDNSIDKSLVQIPPMLIQPFVENAIEHAFVNKKENREIVIQISHKDDRLLCTIADNGIGIQKKTSHTNKEKKSLATVITKERLKFLSKDFKRAGAITIEDRQKYNQQGTIVTLEIPYIIQETS